MQGHLELVEVLSLLPGVCVFLGKVLFELHTEERLVTIHRQVVCIFSNVQGSHCVGSGGLIEPAILILLLLLNHLSASSIFLVRIVLQNTMKSLSWFEESDFIILFEDNGRCTFLMLFFIHGVLVCFEFELMSILQRPLMWILKINCNCYGKLAVASIVNFKWVLINGYQ